MTIGERIKQRREELHMSQEDLARMVGYKSRSSINKIEMARDLPSRKIKIMAMALSTTPDSLLGWDDDQIPRQDDITTEALKLYHLYHSAIPDVQKAVDELLQPDA